MNYKKMKKDELIDLLVKEPKKQEEVSNNTVTLKVWDDKAIDAVNNVSKALLNMTELFKAQNIEVTGIKIS